MHRIILYGYDAAAAPSRIQSSLQPTSASRPSRSTPGLCPLPSSKGSMFSCPHAFHAASFADGSAENGKKSNRGREEQRSAAGGAATAGGLRGWRTTEVRVNSSAGDELVSCCPAAPVPPRHNCAIHRAASESNARERPRAYGHPGYQRRPHPPPQLTSTKRSDKLLARPDLVNRRRAPLVARSIGRVTCVPAQRVEERHAEYDDEVELDVVLRLSAYPSLQLTSFILRLCWSAMLMAIAFAALSFKHRISPALSSDPFSPGR